MGFGVHLIDLVRYLTSQEVVSVNAAAAGMTSESPLESFAQVRLEMDGGAQAQLVYGGAFPLSRNDAVVYGRAGRLSLEGAIDVASGGVLHLATPEGTPPGARIETWSPVVPDHYEVQIEAFSRAVREGHAFAADGLDGLRAVEVGSAIIASQAGGGRTVRVSRA
jgi:predicted dehydrogenase